MNHAPRGRLHPTQLQQLTRPIDPSRVLKDGKGNSHLSQQDVTAHLSRILGYGNYDTEIVSLELVYEQPRDENGIKWDVCYRARVRLTVRNTDGTTVAIYEDVSTGTAQNQKRGDGHDLSSKTAVSLAKKRCTINLGDQFGLSLYNKGQVAPLVAPNGVTLPMWIEQQEGRGEESQSPDVQEGVPQQVSMGDVDPESEPAVQRDPEDVQASLNRAGGQQ